jgi:hypothetical protein
MEDETQEVNTKSRQNLAEKARTADTNKLAAPPKFVKGAELNTTGFSSQGASAENSYKNLMMMTQGGFSKPAEECPYNTSPAKAMFSFSKS